MPSFEPVRAIIRGLQILRVISESGPIGALDISKQVKLPQPTIVRILETLMSAGYIYRLEHAPMYGVTARTLTLSKGFAGASRLVQLATPLIEELRTEIGWPSNLAIFEHGAMSIVYTNRSEHGMSISSRLGARIPVLATGVGLVYLAYLPAPKLEETLAQLRNSDSKWDSNPKLISELPGKLEEVRRNQYALAEEGYLKEIYRSQIWAVAVPIEVGGKVVAGLSSLVLQSAGARNRILSQILPAVRKTAQSIAERVAEDSGLNDLSSKPAAKPKRQARA
ncbi:IclR family transcriptional regulator C-terminal domain-containing protein [Mesorhizobium sp. LHD-90]|uniref:IclR family transcriptional regulator domain-containing protein n=1 Tax=Mesorhizobium sp. LHD-90 TaxID=3071414 RepID=UPI0027E16E0E|nr:IclR family transcriptional regulator C-terminal domain-containing protein [Mesorhizobium sp. LHD-90]MDQ6436965.1 IclR family transcriptional regulator C-terminal domain-containing protein [Mesorhizobium sp. LHD-90]